MALPKVIPVIKQNYKETDKSVTYITPNLSYKAYTTLKNDDKSSAKIDGQRKSRRKRGIVDMIQNAYLYWINKILGNLRLGNANQYPKYKMINGVKYVYSPVRNVYRPKAPKAIQPESANAIKAEEFRPIVTITDFNKGEIVEEPEESRMHKKKFQKMKETVDDAVEDNPWQ